MLRGLSSRRLACFRGPLRTTSRLSSSLSASTREFKVVLDNHAQTLYVDKSLAEALGWTAETGPGSVKLSLRGWDPKYFVITPSGSDAEQLARRTVESGRDPQVQTVLNHLKEYDASRE